jgi:hypothetical protein
MVKSVPSAGNFIYVALYNGSATLAAKPVLDAFAWVKIFAGVVTLIYSTAGGGFYTDNGQGCSKAYEGQTVRDFAIRWDGAAATETSLYVIGGDRTQAGHPSRFYFMRGEAFGTSTYHPRYLWDIDGDAETGTSSSDVLRFWAYKDDGTAVGPIFTAERSKGSFSFFLQQAGAQIGLVSAAGLDSNWIVSAPAGQYGSSIFARYPAGVPIFRWRAGMDNSAETGANAGSDFIFKAYADNGTTVIGNSLVLVRQSLNAIFGGTVQSTSSGRFKTGVTPFSGAVELINRVPVVNFFYTHDVPKVDPRIGFIAEEAPKELTGVTGSAFDYMNVCGVLMKAVQELDARLKEVEG